MSKKKKVKKSFKILTFFIVISLVAITSMYIYKNNNENKEVNSKVETLMKEYNINENEYSKTLEYVLLNNIYDEKYLKEYKDIEFNNQDNISEIITTFLPKGYTGKEINYIFNLSEKNINKLKELDYIDLSNYYEIKNFDVEKIKRYESFYQENDYNYDTVVTYVNINLDLPVYTDTKEVTNPDDLLVLVNKYNYLPSDYKPSDLGYLPGAYGNNVPMREIIIEPFKKLQEAAKEEIGINLMPTTAYRDYNFQKTLYNNYVASDGVKAADTYSARPGHSEHQTGLAFDLNSVEESFANTDEGKWVKDNCYRYGLIIRYPKGKENITGYMYESWHLRYVGVDLATKLYNNGDWLTLEEYFGIDSKYESE